MPHPNPIYSKEVSGRFYTLNSEGTVTIPNAANRLWRLGSDSKTVEMVALQNAIAIVPRGYSWAALGMVRSAFKDICGHVEDRVAETSTRPLSKEDYSPFGAFRLAKTVRYSGSRSGQRVSIPAAMRREWEVGPRSEVAFALLGNIALITPKYAAPYTMEQAHEFVDERWFNHPKADALRAMSLALPDAYKAWCTEVGGHIVSAIKSAEETTESNSYLYPDNSLLGRAMGNTIINDLLDGARIASSTQA